MTRILVTPKINLYGLLSSSLDLSEASSVLCSDWLEAFDASDLADADDADAADGALLADADDTDAADGALLVDTDDADVADGALALDADPLESLSLLLSAAFFVTSTVCTSDFASVSSAKTIPEVNSPVVITTITVLRIAFSLCCPML